MDIFILSAVMAFFTILLVAMSFVFYRLISKTNDSILQLQKSLVEITDIQNHTSQRVSAEISTVRLSISKLNSKSAHKTSQTRNLLNLASALNDS